MTFARGPSGQGKTGPVADVGTAEDVQEFASFATAINIVAAAAVGEPRAARGIMVTDIGAGTKILEVVTAVGQTRNITATNLQAQFLPMSIRSITTNTTVARVLVFW